MVYIIALWPSRGFITIFTSFYLNFFESIVDSDNTKKDPEHKFGTYKV